MTCPDLERLAPLKTRIRKCLNLGGKRDVRQSPNAKPEAAKKVYHLGEDMFSVYHHKHFRVVCQFGPGMAEFHNRFNAGLNKSSFMIFIDDKACSSLPCRDGKDLMDRSETAFTCRHLDLVKQGPACQPESPIFCEDIR